MLSASAIRRLVSPAIAEGTTTRSWPAAFHFATRRATLRMRSTEPTEVPPNFCTISAIEGAGFYRTTPGKRLDGHPREGGDRVYEIRKSTGVPAFAGTT